MSSPPNVFQNVEAFAEILGIEDLLEGRFENDVDGNPIYIGYSPYPNADPNEPIWYVRKVIYDGDGVVRTQLPDDGVGFLYTWTDRATYFS
jgi:hypothetical protein